MADIVDSFVNRRAASRSTEPILPLESCWYVVEGMNIHVRESWRRLPGQPKVVFVHGMGVSSLYMVPTARRVAAFAQVFAPDLPGHGLSDKPDDALELDELARVLARWIHLADAGPAVLVGNSFGCQVGVRCAINHPEVVSGLILQGPTIDPEARSAIRQIGRWFADVPREDLTEGLVVGRDYLLCGFRRMWQTLQIALDDPIEEYLPKVHVPTLVVRGPKDPIVPQQWAERAASLLPHGELSVLERGAHTPNYSTPRELAQTVAQFLDPSIPRSLDPCEAHLLI